MNKFQLRAVQIGGIGLVLLIAGLFYFTLKPKADVPTPSISTTILDQTIKEAWANRLPYFTDQLTQRLEGGDPVVLYDIQTYTNNLVYYANQRHDVALLDQIATLISIPHRYLRPATDGSLQWLCSTADCLASPALKDKEVQLDSQQFLFLVANTLDAISQLGADQRTAAMTHFAELYTPVLDSHYCRWLYYQLAQDSQFCLPSTTNLTSGYVASVKAKFARRVGGPPYNNSVGDKEMWLGSGILELLAAHQNDSALVPLSATHQASLRDFAVLLGQLLESRFTSTQLTSFDGQAVTGAVFDVGLWDTHAQYAYSGYEGEKFPTEADKKAATGVGWDISHGRRLVHVLASYSAHRDLTGLSFPSQTIIDGVANQLAYRSFNTNFTKPLFANFMDGTNGWYRVGYNGPTFGYGPGRLSNSVPTGGYGFWAVNHSDLKKVMYALYQLFQSTDPDSAAHWRSYYAYEPHLEAVMFLPTLLPLARADSSYGSSPDPIVLPSPDFDLSATPSPLLPEKIEPVVASPNPSLSEGQTVSSSPATEAEVAVSLATPLPPQGSSTSQKPSVSSSKKPSPAESKSTVTRVSDRPALSSPVVVSSPTIRPLILVNEPVVPKQAKLPSPEPTIIDSIQSGINFIQLTIRRELSRIFGH